MSKRTADLTPYLLTPGHAVETAKYYPEDRLFLLQLEPTVIHYEVVGQG